MLRTVSPQGSLFELLLPAGMRVLSGELAEVDALLDDERLFVPFRPFFDPVEGRPSIPIETYLRMMFLKVPTSMTARCTDAGPFSTTSSDSYRR